MCINGYWKISVLPASTDTGVSFILVLIFLLQKVIKLGNAVGLLYQSPPPLYLSTARSCAFAKANINNMITSVRMLRFIVFFIKNKNSQYQNDDGLN